MIFDSVNIAASIISARGQGHPELPHTTSNARIRGPSRLGRHREKGDYHLYMTGQHVRIAEGLQSL
jgi:hypothetical protein